MVWTILRFMDKWSSVPTCSRIYERVLADHFSAHRQMALVAGPRQVGKTTVCRAMAGVERVLNWDNPDHRAAILSGPHATAERLGMERLHAQAPIVAFDELHRFGKWKMFLKGFFDTYGERSHILVTGSSRLDTFRRGGDSLMGRYFLFHMHPLSVGELLRTDIPTGPIRPPQDLPASSWQALWTHGGFPEPFLKRDPRFSRRWQDLRRQQLLREDVRDLTRVQELGQLESLALILAERSGGQLIYSNLATEIRTSVDTVRRWVETLSSLHYGFLVRPWFRNVAKALRKEPRWFLRDWAEISDIGFRSETFIACHLLKAVDMWNDLGLGRFELRYLRDKQQREVDFLVVRNRKPWFLVEVKHAETKLSPSLAYYQEQLKVPHAFQLVLDLPYEPADCFQVHTPVVVPARTFLSQLV
jgi:predicted AAA+ superfamily ATPase